jgi:hypothetical protein
MKLSKNDLAALDFRDYHEFTFARLVSESMYRVSKHVNNL